MISAPWITSRVTIFQAMDALGVYDGGEETTRQMLCPVHVDQRPSARVYPDENRVHCYTCGKGWDVIDLVIAVKKVPYPEAIAWLAETFGLTNTADLPAQVRAALTMASHSTAALVAHAEQTIRRSRRGLSCEQFTKITMALDVTLHQQREHTIDHKGVEQNVRRILTHLQSVRAHA